jgi:5-methylcytosine-specific restriction enzyme A
MIQKNDADRITRVISEITGIELTDRLGRTDGHQFILLHTVYPPSPNGFSIRIRFLWRSIELTFIPDNFALPLIETMGHSEGGKKIFSAFATSIINDSGKIDYKINEKKLDPIDTETWDDKNWKCLDLIVIKHLETDPTELMLSEKLVIDWAGRFLNMLLSLLPFEEVDESSSEMSGYPEGATTKIVVNKYERSKLNRSACISASGCFCHICGLTFDDKYGDIGKNFIHVHHIVPVSQLGPDYQIDPINDLIPVCPNCHAMLHRNNPPISIEELKKMIK